MAQKISPYSVAALVAYKTKPALIKEFSGDKITISLANGEQIKVREKDIELIHPGQVKSFSDLDRVLDGESSIYNSSSIREAWEFLLDDGAFYSLKDLTVLIYDDYTPLNAYTVYCLLKDGLYFSGTIDEITGRSREIVLAEESKRSEKLRELNERVSFIELLKTYLKKPDNKQFFFNNDDNNDDNGNNNSCYIRYLQDVESLAFGKSSKSRTMKDLSLGETPEDAHELLLKTGFWTNAINPHPVRYALSLNSASFCPSPPPPEERRDLTHLASFAIDSPWCDDPDDAVSIEMQPESGKYALYVHVADPSSSITPNSPQEKEACNRGATLYLSEKTIRMMAEESLPLFALGLSEKSPALTFKILLDKNCNILNTDIFPSFVSVQRITYENADELIKNFKETNENINDDAAALCALFELSEKILKRREAGGAANIEMPDTHITINDSFVQITLIPSYMSASLVKECMIAAGEAAAEWAVRKGIPFPYISQEVELQGNVPSGLAGSYTLRRCMRQRVLSVKPGRHQGLGVDVYSQVTSPLRRYTDLLAHLQIRAFLRGEKLLTAEEVSSRLAVSEAGASAVVYAQRSTEAHWKMVYLSDKKDSVWNAVALEKKGNRWAVIIPDLALETNVFLQKDPQPNDEIKLILKSVYIPRLEAVFLYAAEK